MTSSSPSRAPDDYWEAICTAIAVGGDVDTTAAMRSAAHTWASIGSPWISPAT